MTPELIIGIGIVVFLLLLLIVCNIRIVPQSKAWVMERLGVYSKTWHTGLHIKIPFIERRRGDAVDLREQILVCGEGFNHGQYHSHDKRNYKSNTYIDVKEDSYNANNASAAAAAGAVAAGNGVVQGGVAGVAGTSSNRNLAYASRDTAVYENYRRDSHNRFEHSRRSQPVITKDNVSMEIDTVIFYNITDPKLYAYGHAQPLKAIEHLAATTLRNIVGGMELDETLSSRDSINLKLRKALDEATDSWGIKVTRVEIRNIIISDAELAEAMEKQMIAERTKRAQILLAEGEKKSEILKAEGKKTAEILVAQGKAEAIKLVNEAAPSSEFLTIRALEAYEVAADGKATKIIVPSNLQSLAGLALSGAEVFKEGEKMEVPTVDAE